MADLDQLNVATERFIQDTPALVDNVFQADPLLAYLKLNVRDDFDGGTLIQEGFFYDGLIGGPYSKGQEFNITEKQVEQAIQLNMKFFEVNVTMSLEDIKVLNKGPRAAFKLIDSRMTNAYMTMGAQMSILQYLNGQNAGYPSNFNGFAEALNDNSTASFDGNTYATYGGITRGGSVPPALNSIPINVAGAIEYNTPEETYGTASFGNIEANLGVTTVLGYSYVKEKFQTQQRLNDAQIRNRLQRTQVQLSHDYQVALRSRLSHQRNERRERRDCANRHVPRLRCGVSNTYRRIVLVDQCTEAVLALLRV